MARTEFYRNALLHLLRRDEAGADRAAHDRRRHEDPRVQMRPRAHHALGDVDIVKAPRWSAEPLAVFSSPTPFRGEQERVAN